MRNTTRLTTASLHIVSVPKGSEIDGLAVGDRLPLAIETKIGRSAESNDYVLPDELIAAEAFQIRVEGPNFKVFPLANDCPVAVNGTQVSASAIVVPDDLVTVGAWTFKFAIGF